MGRYSEVTRTARVKWCPGPESNRYVSFETRDFKSRASASFATRASLIFKDLLNVCYQSLGTGGCSGAVDSRRSTAPADDLEQGAHRVLHWSQIPSDHF